jgi:hypothetical protein
MMNLFFDKFACDSKSVLYIAIALQMEMGRFSVKRLGKMAIAVLLVMSVLLSLFAASSPSLHHFIHSDASQPGHECFVTLLSQGAVDLPLGAVVVAICLLIFGAFLPVSKVLILPAAEYPFPPGRAPPVPSSFLA